MKKEKGELWSKLGNQQLKTLTERLAGLVHCSAPGIGIGTSTHKLVAFLIGPLVARSVCLPAMATLPVVLCQSHTWEISLVLNKVGS